MINIPNNKHVNPNLVDNEPVQSTAAKKSKCPLGFTKGKIPKKYQNSQNQNPQLSKRKVSCPLGFKKGDLRTAINKLINGKQELEREVFLPKPISVTSENDLPINVNSNNTTSFDEANTNTEKMHPHQKRLMEKQQPVKEADSVKEIIEELSPEEQYMVIGKLTDDPLHYAFPRKRVVHPGASGQMLPPPAQQPAWNHYMNYTTEVGNRRAAYIHIPFCSQKCLYCGFFQNYSHEELESNYVNHLVKQLEMAKQYNYLQSSPINAVFFGGGTPSALSPENATKVLKALHRCLPLANDCEITMESTVHDLTEDKLEAWYKNGVNRISIGVQSFDTKIRHTMGRKDPKEVVIENIKRAASYNQGVIIVDLIYGLPYQTVDKFLEDLQTIHELPIDGMDLYQLNIFENSALKQAIDKGSIPPAASTKEQADYLKAAVEFLKDLGYHRLSVCHWSKSNRERSLYNTLAKSDAEVIPFGSGAGGYIKDISMFLHRDLNAYNKLVSEGKWPMMVMLQEPNNKALYKDLQAQTEQLKIDLNILAKKYDTRVLKLEELMNIWIDYGLVTKNSHGYNLTMAGQFWQNNLTQTMIEMLERLLAGKKSISIQPIAAQG